MLRRDGVTVVQLYPSNWRVYSGIAHSVDIKGYNASTSILYREKKQLTGKINMKKKRKINIT